MSRQVHGPPRNVDVHEIVDDPRLDVSLMLVYQHLKQHFFKDFFVTQTVSSFNLFPCVEDLEEADVRLEGLVEGLVLVDVVLDARLEVPHHLVLVALHVVGAGDFDLGREHILINFIFVLRQQTFVSLQQTFASLQQTFKGL